MIARAAIAFVAAALVRAQPPTIWVDVAPTSDEAEEVEKRYTPELVEELHSAKEDALLLYTEYTARAATDLKLFLRNISGVTNDTIRGMDFQMLQSAPESCRLNFTRRLQKIEYNAHRAASFSSENHHKFFLGHMIVFRMHLNKSEDYIKKCDYAVKGCGIKCETTPRITRWRRLAAAELHRVRDDLQHSRKSYRDLLAHAHRRLNTLRKQASARVNDAILQLEVCSGLT